MNGIITEGLLEHLKKVFTDKLPLSGDVTIADINFQQGTLQVVRYLENLHKQQSPTEELINVLQTGRA